MTTVSLPLAGFTRLLAGEFVNDGDDSLTNFNLYQMNLETLIGVGLVNLEIESIRVMLPAPEGLPGDFNNDMVVNAADYTTWRNNLARPTSRASTSMATARMASIRTTTSCGRTPTVTWLERAP